MNAQGYAAVRTGVQFVMAWLVAHATVFAVIPAAGRNALAEWLVTAICVGLWTWAIRYLETRKGDGTWPSAARVAGRLLMLGLGKQPTYAPAAPPASSPTDPTAK